MPVRAAPAAQLSAAEDALARAFPAYAEAIPVINYHDVSERRGVYSTSPDVFAAHLAAGFQSVPLSAVQDLVAGKKVRLPARPILITFDDAVASQYVHAGGVLARYGFRAVAFVPTAFVAERTPSYYLSVGELRQLAASGRWEFGAQTTAGTTWCGRARAAPAPG